MWRRATRRWNPKPIEELLAPATKNADKDGSFYRPALLYARKVKIPNVPQGPRDKSAKKVMKALHERRLAKIPKEALENPNIRVACLIERLPVIQLPRLSWQIDMETVQAFKFEETRNQLPKGMFDVWAKESPKWCIEMFKEHFRHRADELLPMVTPNSDMTDEQILAQREEEMKQAKRQLELQAKDDKKKKKKKSDSEDDFVSSKKAPVVAKAQEDTKLQANSKKNVEPATLWHKEMQELGIELEEVEIEKFDDINIQFSVENDELVKEEIRLQPRITEADRKNDIKSLNRKLEYKLYLVVKQNDKWTFPSTQWKEGENLLQTAERASELVIHPVERKGDLYFVSMVPQGFRASDDGKCKEFILRGQLLHGGFNAKQAMKQAGKQMQDFAWLTPGEICELFAKDGKDEDEVTYLARMLGDDWWQEKDSDELSPVLDSETRKPAKSFSPEEIKARMEQEQRRQEAVLQRLG
ncbi:hypothetical protein BASA81_003022 [Batrachochytrium salamandrivorans]|nr:hypothetical protein BASA81_003022 [Batrachochytrium salamandrivorans]